MTTLSEILKQSPNVGLSIEFCHDLIEDDECNQDGKISEHLAMFFYGYEVPNTDTLLYYDVKAVVRYDKSNDTLLSAKLFDGSSLDLPIRLTASNLSDFTICDANESLEVDMNDEEAELKSMFGEQHAIVAWVSQVKHKITELAKDVQKLNAIPRMAY